MTTYKFFQHKAGISSFAEIDIEVVNGCSGSLDWAETVSKHIVSTYHDAVRSGVLDALNWHLDSGGESAAFKVMNFVELAVDTKADAARCAASVATWKALGHKEHELQFIFDGHWTVRRSNL